MIRLPYCFGRKRGRPKVVLDKGRICSLFSIEHQRMQRKTQHMVNEQILPQQKTLTVAIFIGDGRAQRKNLRWDPMWVFGSNSSNGRIVPLSGENLTELSLIFLQVLPLILSRAPNTEPRGGEGRRRPHVPHTKDGRRAQRHNLRASQVPATTRAHQDLS